MAKRWSEDDIKICMQLVSDNPDNISHAFRLASEATGRSVRAIINGWYNEGQPLNKAKQDKNLFAIMGLGNMFINRKNNIDKGKTSL